MQPSFLQAGRPLAADLGIPAPNAHPTRTAAGGAPMPVSGVMLTPKGERYVADNIRTATAPNVARTKIERAIDRHLTLVTVLLALLDDADGDPDVEVDDDFAVDDEPCDSNTSEDMEYDPGDSPFYPNGSFLFGGGAGI